jgi:PAS domain S-box-containing protein
MDHLWLAAPGFAIKLWRDAATVGWRANPALLDWGRQRRTTAAQWQALADELAAACATAPPTLAGRLQFGGEPQRWSAVSLDAAWLVWLVPAEPAGGAGPIRDSEAYEQLRAHERRIDLVTRAAGVGLWSLDLETDALEWNEQMFSIFGVAAEHGAPTMGHVVDHIIHPDDRAAVRGEREQADDAWLHGRQLEFRIVRPDGSVRWVSNRWRRETLDGRAMVYGVTLDVTERQQAEQALRDKASAEQANRAKSEFLSRMSHELRTPLNAVVGFAQLLKHDPQDRLSPSQAQRIEQINSAGLHLTALIDDVLDLASIESNSLRLEREAVSLQVALDDVLQWSLAQAERAGVTLRAAPTSAWVDADPRRLRQILANLLSNAIKYNRPQGQVWIEFEPCTLRGAAAWCLRVRDSGRGLSPQQRAHLFEPFNRLGAEREGIEGTGIGLTIVRHLVELMGGDIEVDSEPQRGSEFRLRLPATSPALPAGREPAASAALPGPPARALSVLYIEDNAINVRLVQELVAMRPNVRLVTASDGASGVALARAARPDALLIDMQLPDFDGFEVLRRLRCEPSLAGRAFIALSASAMPEDVQRARAAGFDDYWTKPIDLDQFLAGLDSLASARP